MDCTGCKSRGNQIVFISDASGGEGVWIYDIETEEKEQLTKGKDNEYQSPEWIPDGKYVIASKDDPGNHQIWMYHVDGGSGVPLTEEPENLRMLEGAFGADDRYVWFSRRFGTWNYNASLPQYQIATYDRETCTCTKLTLSMKYSHHKELPAFWWQNTEPVNVPVVHD